MAHNLPTPPSSPERKAKPTFFIEEATEEDLPAIAESYYASFPSSWHEVMEHSPIELGTRIERFKRRMVPSLKSGEARWLVARLGGRVVGCACWLPNASGKQHHWRSDILHSLSLSQNEVTSEAEWAELWEHTNLPVWDATFESLEDRRSKLMAFHPGEYAYLMMVWVLPEVLGLGVGKALVEEVMKEGRVVYADAAGGARAWVEGRGVVERRGWEGVMIRPRHGADGAG